MTPEQQSAWDAQGFLVVENALTGNELREVQDAARTVEARWRADTSWLGQRSRVLEQVQAPIEGDSRLLELLWHPQTFPLVRAALGDDVMMIDNDLFLTPPRTPHTHTGWHHDVNLSGVYHPQSTLMVKVFFLLSDVNENSGGTAMVPGSHRFPPDHTFPSVGEPREMPGALQMRGKAGTAYLFNGRTYHCAVNNESDIERRVLIYNYGHSWMRMWPGYEPSERLKEAARTANPAVSLQLLGMTHPYGSALQ